MDIFQPSMQTIAQACRWCEKKKKPWKQISKSMYMKEINTYSSEVESYFPNLVKSSKSSSNINYQGGKNTW